MPIYAYRCSACGHAQDVLQKISDPLLSTCPACGQATYTKQVTAAGFQLKGSGWYVTDFRGGNTAAGKGGDKPADGAADAGGADKAGDPGAEKAAGKPADKPADKAPAAEGATKAAAPAPAPAKPTPPASGR